MSVRTIGTALAAQHAASVHQDDHKQSDAQLSTELQRAAEAADWRTVRRSPVYFQATRRDSGSPMQHFGAGATVEQVGIRVQLGQAEVSHIRVAPASIDDAKKLFA